MIKLSKISTKPPKGAKKKDFKKKTKEIVKEIAELQERMTAEGKHSLLVIFQGMDSSGKDGASRNVFSRCSPTGVSATSFKKPTDEEFAHDFLWRIHKQMPEKGQIKIFNRSQYEDILIQWVHGWISDEKAHRRMASINALEELVQYDNNTTVLKFYMHLSQERQQEKLQERIDDPEKNWKHNDNDWKESKYWNDYRRCYEYAINNSSIAWNIAPVDARWYRDYFIASKVLETLKGMNIVLPVLKEKPKVGRKTAAAKKTTAKIKKIPAAKKAVAKKRMAKKAVAKKAAARTVRKKPAVKKAVAKKVTARRTTRKKAKK